MQIIEINSLSYPDVEVFSTLTEAQRSNRLELQKGIFIAESPKVIHVARSGLTECGCRIGRSFWGA